MIRQWLKFAGMCSVVIGIVIFCVIFGGYSSLHRSQQRIEASKELVTNACQSKLDLLSQLLNSLKNSEYQKKIPDLKQTGKNTNKILRQVISQKTPLDKTLTLKFEASQEVLTSDLTKLFSQLDQSPDKSNAVGFQAHKKQFSVAQNNLFAAKITYNKEVTYFNTRTKIFPGFLIAKLFGFNKIKYFKLSENSFLPSRYNDVQSTGSLFDNKKIKA
jgi:LemA protein